MIQYFGIGNKKICCIRILYCLLPIAFPIAIGSLLLTACSDSPFKDYSETPNGLLYKLQDIGEGSEKAKVGDYLTAQITIKSEKDSVIFDTQRIGLDGAITFILSPSEYEKDYREGFAYLAEGDSATFITDAYTLFVRKNKDVVPVGMNLKSNIKVEVRLLQIQTKEDHEKEMIEQKKQLEMGEFEEKSILEKYLADSSINAKPIANGMYFIVLREGKGISPDSAAVALINYRGCFLNGRCFDSNYETQPFEYNIGSEEQLIKGLEIGVKRMKEGEKTRFIIPSHLAFGNEGSSTGIIPPFTTVVYDVELLKVQ